MGLFDSELQKLSNVIGTAAERINDATNRFRNITRTVNDIGSRLNRNAIENTVNNAINNAASNVIGSGRERINDALNKFENIAGNIRNVESAIENIMNGNDLAQNLNELFDRANHKLRKEKAPTCKEIFNPGTFISRLKNGIAYANRYRVRFQLPSGIPDDPERNKYSDLFDARAFVHNIRPKHEKILNGNETINLFCQSVTFPSRDLQVFELRQHGPTHAFPQTVGYLPVTMTFYADSTMNTRRYFEIWQGAVHNIVSNSYNFHNEYVSDINLWVLDREGNEKYGVKLYEAWPVSIGQMDFSYSSMDTVQTVSVSFRYRYWKYMEPGPQ